MKGKLPWIVSAVAVAFALAILIYTQAQLSRGPIRTPQSTPFSTRVPIAIATPEILAAETPALVTPVGASQLPVPTPTRASGQAGFKLSGKVLSDRGNPVAGAKVTVVLAAGASVCVSTDAGGGFAFADLSSAQVEAVTAEAAGFARSEMPQMTLPLGDELLLSLSPAAGFVVRLLAADASTSGTVPYSGDATIYLMRRQDASGVTTGSSVRQATVGQYEYVTLWARAASIRDGVYRVDSVDAGTYKVAASAGTEYGESQPLQVAGSGDVEAAVILGARTAFEAMVKGEDTQQPIAGADVSVRLASSPVVSSLTASFRSATSSAGTVRFDSLVPATHLVTVAADGYTTRTEEQPVPPPGDGKPVYILRKGVPRVTVRIFSAEGRPLSGAPLVLFNSSSVQPRSFFARTDASGTYTFEVNTAGRYTLAVTAPDDRLRQKNVEVVVGEGDQKSIDVRFGRSVKVGGFSLENGGPAPGLLTFVPRASTDTGRFARADQAGSFTIELEPGEYVVTREGSQRRAIVSIPPVDKTTVEVSFR